MTEKKQFLEAGRIVNTHGVRGEVKIQPWADSPEFLKDFGTLYIDGAPVKVRSARVHKGCVIASLEDIDDVNGAMRLKGKLVSIDRRDAKLPEGGYFIQDIIGARVVDENGAEVGTLAEVLNLPGSDVYVVRGEREILIPAVPQFILSRDIDAGVITVRMMEGL
ncbi:MAG TPA: ribosome maturation factor RimM [Firmicutes bacterium]|nr:ribosome maturation factor RimM [Bacillota bacterium]